MEAACKSNEIVLRLHDTVEDNDDIRFEDLESIFGLDVRRTFLNVRVWSTGPALALSFVREDAADSGACHCDIFWMQPRHSGRRNKSLQANSVGW